MFRGFTENIRKVWANSPYKKSTATLEQLIEKYEKKEEYKIDVSYLSQRDYKTEYFAKSTSSGKIKEGDKYFTDVFHWLSDIKKRELLTRCLKSVNFIYKNMDIC